MSNYIYFNRSTPKDDTGNSTTEENRNEYLPNVITTTGTYVTTTDDINHVKSELNESKSSESSNVSAKPNLINSFLRKRPQLFEPRPFSKSTEATTSRPRTTQITKVSESSYDLTSKSDLEHNKNQTEKSNVNFRSRGNSRFHPNRNINTDENEKQLIPSKRRILVTEKYVEENRTYRPSEIADLSSLTAVDFDNIKGLNPRTYIRRRRPLKQSTTTEKILDIESTPNSLKRRRIHIDEASSGDTRIVPEYKTSQTTESNIRFSPRNRKIIRRFRTTTVATALTEEPEEKKIQINSSKSVLDAPSKTNEVDDDSFEDTTTEEDENIKLSESNIRENSDINSFKADSKLRQKLFKSEIYGKSSIYDKNVGSRLLAEKETTSSTEPTITSSTEPSIFHRTRKIIRKIVPTEPSKIVDKEVDSDQIFGRKRKIIRKLRPISKFSANITSSVSSSQINLNDTNYSILNEHNDERNDERLPGSDDLKDINNLNDKEETPKLPKRVFRPRFGSKRTSSSTSTTPEIDITTPKNIPRNKTILLRGPSRNYRPTFKPTPSDREFSSEPSVEIEKFSPRYTYISRRRPTKDNNLSKPTEIVSEIPEYIITTLSESDQTDIYDTTTENDGTTYYQVDQKSTDYMTTTENLSSETTYTEYPSTEHVFISNDNDINFDINSHYTENPTTYLNFETTTKLKPEDDELSTIITDQTTEQNVNSTDTTTELPKTTIGEVPIAANEESVNNSYRINLKSVNSRPKYNPSKLNLTNSQTPEPSVNAFKPKLNYRTRFQSSTSDDTSASSTAESVPVVSETSTRSNHINRFNRYKSGFRTSTQKPRTEETQDKAISSTTLPLNKFLYKYKKPKPQVNREEEKETDDFIDEDLNNNEETSEKPKSRYLINKNTRTTKTVNIPYFEKSTSKLPSFTKTTTEVTINDDLKNINTDAVKNRNKSLFNSRKVNPNLLSPSTSPSTVALEESTTYYTDDSTDFTTEPSTSESTEHPTTLVHIFAQKGDNTTEGPDKFNQTTSSKIERIIEVNRIINFKTKEDVIKNHHVEHGIDKESSPFYDKIGSITRVTNIKVVDEDGQLVNSNETRSPVYITDFQSTESPIKSSVDMIIQIAKIQEVPAPDNKVNLTNFDVQINDPISLNREERRFDLVSSGKLDDSKYRNVGKAEIIDGISHINVITPRPIYLTESSTIALEGLFQTEKPTLFTSKNSINEELLETENSKFVNVRILHPDEDVRLNADAIDTKVIPIKLLKQDDEDFILRARVVEVSPKSPFNTIKIVPIKVESAKKMPPPLPLIRINRQHN